MWIDYGGAYFNDVDGNVIEKEGFDKDDSDFDDYYDDRDDCCKYNSDETEFFNNEALEQERRIERAIERATKNGG